MARNRMIKPEFWSSSTLSIVSRDARLTFIGMWNFCDDYGFCLSSIRSLIGDLYPYDDSVTEAKIKQWVTELIEVKLLIPVEYKTKKLFFVKGWGEHQTVANKSKRTHIETIDLEDVIKKALDTNEILISNYLDSHAPKRKKKEKEESNKEKEESNNPTLDEVKKYFAEKGYRVDTAIRAFEFYNVADWFDSKGNKVKNWKQKMNSVWFKDENKIMKTNPSDCFGN